MSTRVETDTTGDRPFPIPPRGKNPNMKIFALLVGIDLYEGNINQLGGCEQDVNQLKSYIESKYGERAIVRTLINSEATYANIITAFEEHLINNEEATGNDTFWFHFSGHGSEQFTANEFWKPKNTAGEALASLAPNGKDQNLVCFNPGGTMDGIFLADKELAVLIEKINTTVRTLEGGSKPHILITLDCCHSGTGTRDDGDMTARKFDFLKDTKDRNSLDNPSGAIRPLETYFNVPNSSLKDHFSTHKADQTNLSVPHSPHLLISASTNLELAGETSEGGVFSRSFLDTLKQADEAKEPINYLDLFNITRSKAKALRDKQTPQFEPIDNFNPYTAVWEGWILGEPGRYEVLQIDEDWFVNAGAVNGLPVDSKEKVQVLLYEVIGGALVAAGFVDGVGVQDSLLTDLVEIRMDEEQQKLVITEDAFAPDEEKKYEAAIYALPATPIYVKIGGNPRAATVLESMWNNLDLHLDNLSIHIFKEDQGHEAPQIEIEAIPAETDGAPFRNFIINYQLDDQVWFQHITQSRHPFNECKESIHKIAVWKRMLALENPGSQLQDSYDLELLTASDEDWQLGGRPHPKRRRGNFVELMQTATPEGGVYKLTGTKENLFYPRNVHERRVKTVSIPNYFKIKTKTEGEHLHFYLYNMSRTMEIKNIGFESQENTIIGQEIEPTKRVDAYTLDKSDKLGYFWAKLFVTTRPLEKEVLQQSALGETRQFFDEGFDFSSAADQWHCTTVRIIIENKFEEDTAE